MITLYSYPELFGVADNNGYGLKVFAFLKLTGVSFTHKHIFDASAAPRGQLPYIVDDGETIGDSDTIIAHLTGKYGLKIDNGLTTAQRDTNSHLITRMLDDLYWVMSYSRWKDERFWPAFCDALRREHPILTEAALRKRKNLILSVTITKASAATLRLLPTRADLRICRCWRIIFPRMVTCMGRSRLASTLPSTDSSPIFISTRSILHSGSSLRRIPISFGIALQFTPPSVRKFKADGEKKPYSTNRIDLLARALEFRSGRGMCTLSPPSAGHGGTVGP